MIFQPWTGNGGTGTEEYIVLVGIYQGCDFRHCLGTGHWVGIPDIYNHNHFIVNLRHKMNLIFFLFLVNINWSENSPV